jgi:uncharacterized protein (DUF2461 family)
MVLMVYFTQDLFQFLLDLKENNDREWFQQNKPRYEALSRHSLCGR